MFSDPTGKYTMIDWSFSGMHFHELREGNPTLSTPEPLANWPPKP